MAAEILESRPFLGKTGGAFQCIGDSCEEALESERGGLGKKFIKSEQN